MAEYAFIHIPKNAGMSFENKLKDIPEIDYFPHGVLKTKIENHKKIYVMRDPVDRFTSAFFYLRGYKKNKERNYFQTPNELLESLRNLDPRSLEFMKIHDGYHHVHGNRINTDWVFHKQSSWIYDPWKILIFERIHEDLRKLGEELGLDLSIPHINKSVKEDFTYSESDISLLKILYKEDFVLYNQYANQ